MRATALDEVLADVVTPLLRAAGWQKSGRRYVRVAATGDSAEVHFDRRDTDVGEAGLAWTASCSVTIAPVRAFRLSFLGVEDPKDRVRAATWSRQWFQVLPSGEMTGFWSFSRGADREHTADQMRTDLRYKIIPQLDALLDRSVFLDCLRIPTRGLTQLRGRFSLDRETIEAVLLAQTGPSPRLAQLLDNMVSGYPLLDYAGEWVVRCLREQGTTNATWRTTANRAAPALTQLLADHVDKPLGALGYERTHHTYRAACPIGGTQVLDFIPSADDLAHTIAFYLSVGRQDIPGSARPPQPRAAPPPGTRIDDDVRTQILGLPRWISKHNDATLANELLAIAKEPPEQ